MDVFRLISFCACWLLAFPVQLTLPIQGSAQESNRKPLSAEQQAQLKERDRLADEADKHQKAGKFAEAITAVEKKLAIERAVLGNFDVAVDRSLVRLAKLHRDRNDFPPACNYLRESLALRTKVYGPKDWEVTTARLDLKDMEQLARLDAASLAQVDKARMLNTQVFRLWQQQKYQEALPLAQEVVKIWRQSLGEGHRHYASALGNLGAQHRGLKQFDEAETAYQRSLFAFEQLLSENHPTYIQALVSLAEMYEDQSNTPKALLLFERACDLQLRLMGENDRPYVNYLQKVALLHIVKGNYAKALPLLEKSRDLYKHLLGESHRDYATSLGNLAQAHHNMGDYGRALSLHEQTLNLRKRILGELHPDYAESLYRLSSVYCALGDLNKALPLVEQSNDLFRRILGADHPRYASSLLCLASVRRDMGDFDKALPLYEQACELRRRLWGEGHPEFAISQYCLASLHLALNDRGKALLLFQKSRNVLERLESEYHLDLVKCLNEMALLHMDTGELSKALPLLEQANDVAKRRLGDRYPDNANLLNNLAVLHQLMGNDVKALSHYEQALGSGRTRIDRTSAAQSYRQRLDSFNRSRAALDGYLGTAIRLKVAAGDLYDKLMPWKGLVWARAWEEQLARDQPDLEALLQQLQLARASFANVARQVPATPQQRADWRRTFDELEAEKEKLESEIARKSEAFRIIQQLAPAGAKDVARALPARTVLVDFFVYSHKTPSREGRRLQSEPRLLAFVIRSNGEATCIPLGPVEPIQQAVENWRLRIGKNQNADEAAENLARLVWQPLGSFLGDASTVLISPDGPVTGVSFAALPGKQKGRYLLEEVAVGYVTSGRQLLELAVDAKRPLGNGLLALGGVDYGLGKTPAESGQPPVWKPLPGTHLEVERIAHTFRKFGPESAVPVLLTNQTGDVARLKRELDATTPPRWRYVHLATHGFFEKPNPKVSPNRSENDGLDGLEFGRELRTYVRNPLLASGVVMAGANSGPGRGILTAEEVVSLDLRGCDLVVLSACETGLGKVANGEGVFGLQRAFQCAGARSLVVSLWSVNDAATSVLMEEFYDNLWAKKLPKLEALRQAQLTVYRNPARVEQRRKELRETLSKRGVSEAELAERGIGKEAGNLPNGGQAETSRGPTGWWGAFVLSGECRPQP